jgi:beta-glucosidase
MFETLGDRVALWATHNEPRVVSFLGYGDGVMAPGVADFRLGYQTAHHLLLAHGKAVQAFRQGSYRGEIGITLDREHCQPAGDSDADQAAWRRYHAQDFRLFADPLFKGEYPAEFLVWLGPVAPRVASGDLQLISSPLDFLGVNDYRSTEARYDPDGGHLKCRARSRTLPMWGYTEMGWAVYPAGLTAVLLAIQAECGNPNLYITENSCATRDTPDANGFVDDVESVDYLRGTLWPPTRRCRPG